MRRRQRRLLTDTPGQRSWQASFLILQAIALLVAGLVCTTASPARAGPPFVTDDPEPVEYRHWEVYAATQVSHDQGGAVGTLPHIEVNYGVAPEVQLHLLVPLAWSRQPGGPTLMGPGDIEAGVKYRFMKETDHRPQVGTFVMVEVPTGSPSRNLGTGHVRVFLPVWLQKSFGPWTTYGGGGYWFNRGPGLRDYWFFGWEGQRALSKSLTVGAELFYLTSPVTNGRTHTGFNVGGQINFDEEHHLLFSVGRDLGPQTQFSAYLAWQWTFGPPDKKQGMRTGAPPFLLVPPTCAGSWNQP